MNNSILSVLLLTRHPVTEPVRFAAWLGALLESPATTPTHWQIGRRRPVAFDREAVQATVGEHRATGRIEVIHLCRKRPPKYELGFSCPDDGLRFVTLNYDGVPSDKHLPDVFAVADRMATALVPEFGYADFPWDGRDYGLLFPGVMTWKTLNQLGPTLGYRRTYLGPHACRLARGSVIVAQGATASELGEVLRVDLSTPPWAAPAGVLAATRTALLDANNPLGVFRQRVAPGTATAGPAWVPLTK